MQDESNWRCLSVQDDNGDDDRQWGRTFDDNGDDNGDGTTMGTDGHLI
jgi:hypothetical protein